MTPERPTGRQVVLEFLAAPYWLRLVDDYAKRQKLRTSPTVAEWDRIYDEILAKVTGADGRPRSRKPEPTRGLLYESDKGGLRRKPEIAALFDAVEAHKQRAADDGRKCTNTQALRELFRDQIRHDPRLVKVWATQLTNERRRRKPPGKKAVRVKPPNN